MTAEHDFPGVPDPLMSVIADEPLPESVREDAGFLAAHRSAAADVAILREQLGIIGDALGRAPEGARADMAPEAAGAEAAEPAVRISVPARSPRPRRRPFALALGGLAVACAAAVASGAVWLLAQPGGATEGSAADKGAAASEQGAGRRFGSPRYLACAHSVAEGTVIRVEPVPGAGWSRITLDVTRSYKPDRPDRPGRGADPLVFLLEDGGVPGPLRPGDHALIGVSGPGGFPDAVFVGEREIAAERAWIVRSLSKSRTLTCPGT
ncbi:hypothetical protein AB0M97_18845 [Streptomyces sp. NPDC051207]|uniref:hypothetical protein n=1 Tax=Streptomyces sp. NPDC051207 TaxID=3154641 RepID=UPI003440F1C6